MDTLRHERLIELPSISRHVLRGQFGGAVREYFGERPDVVQRVPKCLREPAVVTRSDRLRVRRPRQYLGRSAHIAGHDRDVQHPGLDECDREALVAARMGEGIGRGSPVPGLILSSEQLRVIIEAEGSDLLLKRRLFFTRSDNGDVNPRVVGSASADRR